MLNRLRLSYGPLMVRVILRAVARRLENRAAYRAYRARRLQAFDSFLSTL